MPSRSGRATWLLLTCEHGGNRIPREYANRFRGADRTLASHRGWDPGALLVARELRAPQRRGVARALALSLEELLASARH